MTKELNNLDRTGFLTRPKEDLRGIKQEWDQIE